MKKLIIVLMIMCRSVSTQAQVTELKYYNPDADAIADVNKAIMKAGADNKNILLQIGGNWCKWCRLYDRWSHSSAQIDSLINANYVVVHVNFSPENKNPELMKRLGYPQRFGFPVIVILDSKGNRLHTQNTGYLEEGEGYNEKKVAEFLNQWSVAATSGEGYK